MGYLETDEMVASLGITQNTYKSHAKGIREAMSVDSVREACRIVWTRMGNLSGRNGAEPLRYPSLPLPIRRGDGDTPTPAGQ